MTYSKRGLSAGKPPSEVPMPADPDPKKPMPENPQPSDPDPRPVSPEVPKQDPPLEEPDPFEEGNFPV